MLRDSLQRLRDRLILLASRDSAERQAGAIPYTIVQGQVVFLLVTSRRSGRWIFPKGELAEGMTPWELAAHEAYEEAGVKGEVDTKPIGSYRTMKTFSIRRQPIVVDLYPLRVQEQLEEWPEKEQRHRHWAILPEAKRLLFDAKLADMAVRLSRSLAPKAQPATARMK
jgi:8-oxo-dGTP pyrophosphatase MutT (NUDIX family)